MIVAGAPALLVKSAAQGQPPLPATPLRACLGACAATPLGLLALHRAGLQLASLEDAAADGAATSCSTAASLAPCASAGSAPAIAVDRGLALCTQDAALAALAARLGPCLDSGSPGPSSSNGRSSVVDELACAHLAEMLLAAAAPAVLGAFRTSSLSAGAAAAAWMARRPGSGSGPCSGTAQRGLSPQGGAGGADGPGAGAQVLRGLASLISEALSVLRQGEPASASSAAGAGVHGERASGHWVLSESDAATVLAAVAALQAAMPDVHASAAHGRLAEWVAAWVAGAPGHRGMCGT